MKILNGAIQEVTDSNKQELAYIASKKCSNIIKQFASFYRKKLFPLQVLYISNEIAKHGHLSKLSSLGRIELSTQSLQVKGNPDQVLMLNGKSEYEMKVN
ncbi:hypothetical protein DPMN_005188 [Dreissena polymorpha]|uniref:Uncharacterized protein n=1 Tax=Dreissena polymorpha TaxID=45954 RepID=A0A9D4RU68_DREPO|nr:hypothetical protein DPMN_005188 [Dreissena polymorpha]